MSQVEEVFNVVSAHFIWQSDKDSHGVAEHWDHFADQVRAGQFAHRDCEDFALTCLIIGIEDHGWDIDKCRIARVLTESGERDKPFNHAVAIYGDTMLDNRQRGPVPVGWARYEFYDYATIPLTDWYLYESGQQFLQKGHH